MKLTQSLVFLFAIAGLPAIPAAAQGAPASCPVTQPPQPPFVPPAPYVPTPSPGRFYVGTEKLWTTLSAMEWRAGAMQKRVWWSAGYDWKADSQPALAITGKRLDGPAPPLVYSGHGNGSYRDDMGMFIMSGFHIPTTGCWEITGRYKAGEVKFVVWVGR